MLVVRGHCYEEHFGDCIELRAAGRGRLCAERRRRPRWRRLFRRAWRLRRRRPQFRRRHESWVWRRRQSRFRRRRHRGFGGGVGINRGFNGGFNRGFGDRDGDRGFDGFRGGGWGWGGGWPAWDWGYGIYPYDDGYPYYGYSYPNYDYSYPYYNYGYPYSENGYAYSPGYAPNVTVINPPEQTSQISSEQHASPVVRNYDQYGQEITPSRAGSNAAAGPASNSSPIYLVAFKDGTIRAVDSYNVKGDTLHYVTLQHEEKEAPLDSVDRNLSQRLNRERNVAFSLGQAKEQGSGDTGQQK